MKRNEELQTPIGQAAWNYYQLWFREMKRRTPDAKSFISSKYYRTFFNFATFVQQVDLPRPEKFIWLMAAKTYQPTMWMIDDVYVEYLEFLDYKVAPLEQAKLSIETILKYADRHGIDPSDIFSVLTSPDLIHMLRTRKLSPWFLLNSKKFKQFFINDTSPEQKIIIETLIQPEYWAKKWEDYPEELQKIKRLIAAMDV